MKQKLRWKRFIVFSLVLLPIFLLFDVVADLTKGRVQWDEIWAMKNMFFKVLAALVGGYFASTNHWRGSVSSQLVQHLRLLTLALGPRKYYWLSPNNNYRGMIFFCL